MLRKCMTDAEKRLWSRLRSDRLGVKFRRQVPLGPYIVDFYCSKARLAVELDGSQHHTESGLTADLARDAYFATIDIKVVRYTNSDVLKNTDSTLQDLLEHLNQRLNSAYTEGATKV